MDELLTRWRDLLVGTGYDPTAAPYKGKLHAIGTRADKWRDTMTLGAASSLWPDLPIGHDSGSITGSYHRLRDMALAYAMPGTGLTGDASFADDVRRGLRHVNVNAYNDQVARYANWWDWQIGAPQALLDCCVLVQDEHLPDYLDAVDHFVPASVVAQYSGISTGANRVDLCRVLGVRGALGDAADLVKLAAGALSPVFVFVASGDGLYADGSFIQHRTVPYTGSYGVVLLDGLARMLTWLEGTAWEITDPFKENIYTSVERAYAPFLHDGFMMDCQSGRAVSRGPDQNDHTRGVETISAILLLAGSASAEQAATWRGLAKGWLRRGGKLPSDVADLALCRAVLDDTALAEVAEPLGSRVFAGMDRVLHRRPGWTLAVAMCSSRIAYYETGNGEHLRGWHSSAGMTYWWAGPDDPYADGFWPTADPYRLPGTTVSRKVLPKAAGDTFGKICPQTPWAGGVSDGTATLAAQRVRGLLSTLSAKKSWFCLDDAVVCLGTEITSEDGLPVESTVEHRIVPATARLIADGAEVAGPSATVTTRWMAVEGVGGYLFPGSATVRTLSEDRTGAWQDINSARPATPVTRHYRTIWFAGTDPYAYALLPGATPDETAARAGDEGWLTILANTGHLQAIQAGQVTGATFWAAGEAGPLTVDRPCCVLLRVSGSRAVLSVADPARSGGVIEVGWAHPAAAVVSKAKTVTVVETAPAVRLRVAVGRRGASHKITLTL